MSPEKEAHLHDLKHRFANRLDFKYRKGAAEHNESLPDKTDLLEEAVDEVLDLYVYLTTEIDRRRPKPAEPPEEPTED
jgi:hypothetical protein